MQKYVFKSLPSILNKRKKWLHSPSMLAESLIWLVLYNQSNFYRFWGNILLLVYSVFFLFFIGHHTDSKPTGLNQYGSNFQTGKTVQAEHGCSSLLGHFVTIGIIYPMKLDDACANFTHEGTNSSYSWNKIILNEIIFYQNQRLTIFNFV